MGCGHSKINIYPKKSKGKSNSKKSVSSEKADSEEEEGIETEGENVETADDCDQRKTIRVKPFGGQLLAQAEISTSQQDFFRMLDERIQNGPDYNSESESEKAAESMRIRSLIKDWETASQGSRSLPSTPKRWPPPATSRDNTKQMTVNQTQLSQSVIHQSYGVTSSQLPSTTTSYRQLVQYNTQQMPHPYQAMYGAPPPPTYLARPQDIHNRTVVTYDQRTGAVIPNNNNNNRPAMSMVELNRHQQQQPELPGRPMSNYEQRSNSSTSTSNTLLPAGSYLARTLENSQNRPMTTTTFEQQQRHVHLRGYGGTESSSSSTTVVAAAASPKRQPDMVAAHTATSCYSPTHRMYGGAAAISKERNNCEVMYKPVYSNGDLIQQQQQQLYPSIQQYPTTPHQQPQYMVPASHDQAITQYQQQQTMVYHHHQREPSTKKHNHHQPMPQYHHQSSSAMTNIPIIVQTQQQQQTDMMTSLNRKQYELT